MHNLRKLRDKEDRIGKERATKYSTYNNDIIPN